MERTKMRADTDIFALYGVQHMVKANFMCPLEELPEGSFFRLYPERLKGAQSTFKALMNSLNRHQARACGDWAPITCVMHGSFSPTSLLLDPTRRCKFLLGSSACERHHVMRNLMLLTVSLIFECTPMSMSLLDVTICDSDDQLGAWLGIPPAVAGEMRAFLTENKAKMLTDTGKREADQIKEKMWKDFVRSKVPSPLQSPLYQSILVSSQKASAALTNAGKILSYFLDTPTLVAPLPEPKEEDHFNTCPSPPEPLAHLRLLRHCTGLLLEGLPIQAMDIHMIGLWIPMLEGGIGVLNRPDLSPAHRKWALQMCTKLARNIQTFLDTPVARHASTIESLGLQVATLTEERASAASKRRYLFAHGQRLSVVQGEGWIDVTVKGYNNEDGLHKCVSESDNNKGSELKLDLDAEVWKPLAFSPGYFHTEDTMHQLKVVKSDSRLKKHVQHFIRSIQAANVGLDESSRPNAMDGCYVIMSIYVGKFTREQGLDMRRMQWEMLLGSVRLSVVRFATKVGGNQCDIFIDSVTDGSVKGGSKGSGNFVFGVEAPSQRDEQGENDLQSKLMLVPLWDPAALQQWTGGAERIITLRAIGKDGPMFNVDTHTLTPHGPVFIYRRGQRIKVHQAEERTGLQALTWKLGTIKNFDGLKGSYTIRYDGEANAELAPPLTLRNHFIVPSLRYREGADLVYCTQHGWADVTVEQSGGGSRLCSMKVVSAVGRQLPPDTVVEGDLSDFTHSVRLLPVEEFVVARAMYAHAIVAKYSTLEDPVTGFPMQVDTLSLVRIKPRCEGANDAAAANAGKRRMLDYPIFFYPPNATRRSANVGSWNYLLTGPPASGKSTLLSQVKPRTADALCGTKEVITLLARRRTQCCETRGRGYPCAFPWP
ncbi:hypothetical protein CYMTET_33190 [Cymbomonas tetramitiformis]|uniref:Uncharacterized protein n=1 Tax=Cymbomonas tetramitiformis TaxID=36881 RepID=A0AAE0KRG2_9CHLO|nr:hypothetical protein CYMTET_33190 [Cymbomonas tetramitiformis]